MRFLFLLLFFAFACEEINTRKETCSLQGFNSLKSKCISCTSPLDVQQINFSTGSAFQIIRGNVKLNNKAYPFSVLLDSLIVIKHKFPLSEIDSGNYQCNVQLKDKQFVQIIWSKGNRRLFIKKFLPQ